jgi:hypothetical protein
MHSSNQDSPFESNYPLDQDRKKSIFENKKQIIQLPTLYEHMSDPNISDVQLTSSMISYCIWHLNNFGAILRYITILFKHAWHICIYYIYIIYTTWSFPILECLTPNSKKIDFGGWCGKKNTGSGHFRRSGVRKSDLEFNCSGVLFLLNLAKLIDFCFGVEVSTIKRIQLFLNLRLLSVNRSAALHLVCCNENIGTPWNS